MYNEILQSFKVGMQIQLLVHNIRDPLWKNRPLANFFEIDVFGMDQRRISWEVQLSKNEALNIFLAPVMAKNLYPGYPGSVLQFF